MRTEEGLGQPVQPAQQRLELTEKVSGQAVLFDQIRGMLNIGNGQRMGYRLIEQLVLPEPAAGPAVEFRNQDWLCLPQTAVQYLGKQVMVAIPLTFIVEGEQEQMAPLDLRKQRLAIVSPAHTASHNDAQSRPSMQVCTKKSCTAAGW